MKLNELEHKALKKFKITLEKVLGKNLVDVKLFGSKARGDADKDSDIDVLVLISSDDWHICDIVYDIATDILLETGVCLSPKIITQKDYSRLSEIGIPFIKNVSRDGISI